MNVRINNYSTFIQAIILLFVFCIGGINLTYAQENPVPATTAVFSDVDIGHPEYLAIKYLKEIGIIKGYDDGSFRPGKLINRAEALKIILIATKKINDEYIKNNSIGGINFTTNTEIVKFSDVFKSNWYFPYIKKAVEDNIVSGYQDGTFKPYDTVNRAESIKMFMESDKVPLPEVTENPFEDVYKGDWYAAYFLESKIREIVFVSMANNVNPGFLMTRSQFAELIYRYLKSKEGCRYGIGTFYSDWFEGRGTTSGEPYKAAELTAAHLTLPFNTIVKVTNLENGKSVTVRINDRGPFVTGRVIDLSRAAFEQIAYPGEGIIWVEYQVITQS